MYIKKIVIKILEISVFITLLAIGVFLVFSKLDSPYKYDVYVVHSGSMGSALNVGSLALVRPYDTYIVGDIITFTEQNTGETITHRIIETDSGPIPNRIYYKVKGDANEESDIQLVNDSSIKGKVFFSLPVIGYFVYFVKTKIGLLLFVVLPALLIIVTEIRNVLLEVKRLSKFKVKQSVLNRETVNEIF